MTLTYDTLTDLWHGVCEEMFLLEREDVLIAGSTAVVFDRMILAESMDYEMDMSRELWLTAGRFTGLQRDYLDPVQLRVFLERSARASAKRPQIAPMLCRVKGARHVSYKWGNCILGFSFRRVPVPELTMYSRTSMITRIGGIDLALAYCIAREIAKLSGEDVADYRFCWFVSNLQTSALQQIPYYYAHGYHKEPLLPRGRKLHDFTVLRTMTRQLEWMDRVEEEGREMKHGTRRRVIEQRREFLDGKMRRPKVPLSSLDLSKLKEAS